MDDGALEKAWSDLEDLFVAMNRCVQSMAGGTGRLVYEKEEAAARAALAALSYDQLLTLLSDPRWYEPLPEFKKIPSGLGSGCIRFMTCITILPRTEDAVRAVKARPHNPPPLPPKLPRLRIKPLGLRFTFFIIFCIISNWRSSLLTSSTVVPEPAAMRRLRLGLMMSGLARSAGVIE